VTDGRPQYGGVSIGDFAVVCASSLEDFVADDLRVVTLGVGKTAAAMQLTSLLCGAPETRAVLLFGVAGAFPDRHRGSAAPVRRGGVCLVGSDRFGDEGVETSGGFQDLHALRIGDCGPFPANPRMAQQAATLLGVPVVRGVTVSTCSGTEPASLRLWKRCNADVETMEGAAVAYVCRQFELPLLHLRAISNWTGDRDRGDWNLGIAIDAVQQAVRRLARGGP